MYKKIYYFLIPLFLLIVIIPIQVEAEEIFYACMDDTILDNVDDIDEFIGGAFPSWLSFMGVNKQIDVELVASSTSNPPFCVGSLTMGLNFDTSIVWIVLTVSIIWVFYYFFKELLIRLRNK